MTLDVRWNRVEVIYTLWCLAGARTVEGRGVLGGWSAAELLGASCAPRTAPVELIVPGSSAPTRPGLVVRADRVADDQVTRRHGVAVTTAVRTAFDLGRRPPVTEAICAVDALTRRCGLTVAEIAAFAGCFEAARGSVQLPEVWGRSSALSDSPMESRIRVAIEDAGLPMPVLQHAVGPHLLDLASPPRIIDLLWAQQIGDSQRPTSGSVRGAGRCGRWVDGRQGGGDDKPFAQRPHEIAQRLRLFDDEGEAQAREDARNPVQPFGPHQHTDPSGTVGVVRSGGQSGREQGSDVLGCALDG